MTDLGCRIKEIRTFHKLSQDAFGKVVGISNAHVSKLEAGKENASTTLLKLIAYEFNLNYEWVLDGKGTMLRGAKKVSIEVLTKSKETIEKYLRVFEMDYLQNKSCEYLLPELSNILGSVGRLLSKDSNSVERRIFRAQSMSSLLGFYEQAMIADSISCSDAAIHEKLINDIFRTAETEINCVLDSTHKFLLENVSKENFR